MLTGKPPQPAKVIRSEKQMSECLNDLENVWLKDSEFIANNKFSAADLWAACEIEQTSIYIRYDNNL